MSQASQKCWVRWSPKQAALDLRYWADEHQNVAHDAIHIHDCVATTPLPHIHRCACGATRPPSY
jgi:hypothetical protein